LQVGASFNDINDAQIANIEKVEVTATGLTVNLGDQTEGFDVTGFATGATTFVGGSGADTFTGGSGDDSISAGAGADNIVGGSGNDIIVGAQDDALLDGGTDTTGDKLQVGASFNDINDAQIANIEKVEVTATGLTVNLGDQTEGFDVTGFAAGATTFVGGVGADTFTGGSGADSITGGITGVDSIDAGDGRDTIVFADATDIATDATVIGGLGNDTISIADSGAGVVDSNFEDVDTVEALVFTGGGNVSAILETQAQQAGIVSVFGGVGNDFFDASSAAYNTTGVYFQGNGGFDFLVGGDSIDKFVFATVADLNSAFLVVGGNGNDTISLTTDNQTVVDADFTDVLTVEALTFFDGTGSSAVLAGTADAAGIDAVYGGTGNDSLTVDSTIYTAPTFVGSTGTDALSLSNSGVINLTAAFFANLSSVESFYTADGTNDITFGNNGLLTITGGTGDDKLDASAMTSAVTLMGGLGADTLIGGSVGSRQQGWTGSSTSNSTNTAGFSDTLTGGAGADVFVLGDTTDVAYGGSSDSTLYTNAKIVGFDFAQDKFLLNAYSGASTSTFSKDTTANEAYFAKGGAGGVVNAYNVLYSDSAGTGAIFVDGTTRLVAEFTFTAGQGDNISASNFLFA
jgi:Ca2+-binding RTX toxin-like protein